MATTAQFSSPPWSLRKGSGRVQRRLSATRNTVGQDGAPLLSTLHAAELGLVVGFVRVEDALALALVSRATRDLVYARFPRPPPLDSGWGFALPCAARAPRLSTPTAAALDSIARLRWAARCGCHLSEAMAEQCAARSADPRLLDELRTRGVVLSARTCAAAARAGRLEVLRRLRRELSVPWDVETCRQAAGEGHLELLRWAVEHGAAWDDLATAAACRAGQLKVCLLYTSPSPRD